MKVLIVNTSDIQGGAARASYRLHIALKEQGIDSLMLTNEKSSDDFSVIDVANTFKIKVFSKIASFLDRSLLKKYLNKDQPLFSPNKFSTSDVIKAININTCSKEILRSLAQGRILSEAEGDAIIKQRPFETVADFKAIDEYRGLTLNGEFSVNSEFFKVSAKVSLADRVSRLVSILYRDSSNGELTLMERNQGKKYLITKEIFLQQ